MSRRTVLKLLAAVAGGAMAERLAGPAGAPATAENTARNEGAWPALGLHIVTPEPGSGPEVDFRRDFGAVGDGSHDDGPAFRALAEAVNAGRVPPGAVVLLGPGRYRVVGNQTITFRRPVVLRGGGVGATTIIPEYAAQGSVFLRLAGEGMYVRHSTGTYDGRQERNVYPTAPFSAVQGSPARGDTSLVIERPELFATGDQAYLLCDDYGPEVAYRPTNRRAQHFLLKQHVGVRAVEDSVVHLDAPLRHDFGGAAPRLYRWSPLVGFGIEHLTVEDASNIADTEAANTFQAIQFDGVVDGWVWDIHFRNNTSIPLRIGRSRHVVVSECLLDGARHVGGGGNGYLPELYYSDDCLVENCTAVGGRHALICNWSCWGNVLRYNRVLGTPNTETHGEYSVENLYLRNDCRGARMEVGGGGEEVHAHDGPLNELAQNYARILRVLKPNDRDNRLVGNWHVEPTVDLGTRTVQEANVRVPPGWDQYPLAAFCGHDHRLTAGTARPG